MCFESKINKLLAKKCYFIFYIWQQCHKAFMDYLHWQHLLAKPSVTATLDHHKCTCLGHLGRRDTDRIISIWVASPKVAKASTIVTVVCCCRWHFHLKMLPMETHLNRTIRHQCRKTTVLSFHRCLTLVLKKWTFKYRSELNHQMSLSKGKFKNNSNNFSHF
jgi:hypothetical protein